jgi:hypothetical protein
VLQKPDILTCYRQPIFPLAKIIELPTFERNFPTGAGSELQPESAAQKSAQRRHFAAGRSERRHEL